MGKESEAEKKKREQNAAGVEACHQNIRQMVKETYPELFYYSGGTEIQRTVHSADYVDFFQQDSNVGSIYYGHLDMPESIDEELSSCDTGNNNEKSLSGWNVGTLTSILMQTPAQLTDTAEKMATKAADTGVMRECVTGAVKVEYTGSMSFVLGGNALDGFCGDGGKPIAVTWEKKKTFERKWQNGACKLSDGAAGETQVSFNANLGPVSFQYVSPGTANPNKGSVKFGIRFEKPASWENWDKILKYRETIKEVWQWMDRAYNALRSIAMGDTNAFSNLAKWFADEVAAKVTKIWTDAKAAIAAKVQGAALTAAEDATVAIFGAENYGKGCALWQKISQAKSKSAVEWIVFVGKHMFGVKIGVETKKATGFDFQIEWDGSDKTYTLSLADESVTTLSAPSVTAGAAKITVKGVGGTGTMNEFKWASA